MSTPYGFCITKRGHALLAKLLSSDQLQITRVMIGDGKPAEDTNLMDLEEMIAPLARATSTVPITVGTSTSFIIEYRNDMGGEILRDGMDGMGGDPGAGLSRDISINEFAVYARDPERGEIMLYYGCLGDYPDSVKAYTPGDPVISRRYPVSITVVEGVEVILGYDAGAYMTAEDIAEYCQKTLLPQFTELLSGELGEQLDAHNTDPEAHPRLTARMRATELALNGSETILAPEGDPTTETAGRKGQHYINLKTGTEWECSGVKDGEYIWGLVDYDSESYKSMRDILNDAVQGWSGPNLGINCDFRRPVNRNGRDEYTAAGMTIDRWRLSMSAPGISVRVLPEGISIDKAQADVYGRIAQSLDNPGSLSGATVTVSILAKGDTTPYLLLFLNGESSGVGLVNIPLTDEYSLYSRTLTLRGGEITQAHVAVGYQTSTPVGSCALLGFKIDPGRHQTLAHQEEDGRWVLNDPPDYALQYALCSLYSPITGAFVGSRYSNGNLLDNGRFSINQRAQKSYTGARYGIDRWFAVSEGLTVTVNDDGTITLTNNGDTLAYYRQRLEVPLDPGDYTLSTLVTASAPKSGHNAMYCCYDDNTFSSVVYLDAPGLYAVTSAKKAGKNIFRVQYNIAPGGSLTLCAAKLEPGLVQTLAHRDEDGNWVLSDPQPNKALELAKCQRCFVRLSLAAFGSIGIGQAFATDRVRMFLPLPQPMRAAPSLNATPGNVFQLVESPINSGEKAYPASFRTNFVYLFQSGLAIEFIPQDSTKITIGKTYIIRAGDTPAYIDISSDL